MPKLIDGSMPVSLNLVWLVLLLPLIGFLIQAMLGNKIEKAFGRRIVGFLAVLPIVLSFLIGVYVFKELASLEPINRIAISTWFDWIDLQSLRVPFELRVDPLSMLMVLIVTGIGSLIHIYATGYMAKDKEYARFFTYLNLFIAFMLMLVLGNNLALVFIGWEGVGLCSYLLIGFWYTDIANAKAANKAFIVNRIGDWGMVLGIFLIAVVFASSQNIIGDETRFLSFDVILPKAQEVLGNYSGTIIVTAIPLLLFIGAMGKSAQFPLYLWLPDAMAGPTPVSALIHAATMVTAGVYLVARCHVFFEMSPLAMSVVAIIGAFTAVFAATIAFGQTDIKKVLAYSTVSQLGFMFLACGVGAFYTGMFHVTTHAFFKALLFLGAGAVIHAMSHNQDMRNYGRLWKYLPVTFFTMLIGWLAICGIPPLAGFFSKDDILAKTYTSSHYWHEQGWTVDPKILYFIGLGTALMTAAYMTRLFWLTFMGENERWRQLQPIHHEAHAHSHADVIEKHVNDENGFYLDHEEEIVIDSHHELDSHHTPKEVSISMWFPLAVLALLSIGGGLVLSGAYPLSELWHLDWPHLFREWLAPVVAPVILPAKEMFHADHSTEYVLILSSVFAALLGIGLMVARYKRDLPEKEKEIRGIQAAAGNQWFFDTAMYSLFVKFGGKFSEGFYRIIDKGLIDGFFVNGSAFVVGGIGKLLRKTQVGYVRTYAMAMLVGGVAILSYIIFASSR